MLLYLFLALRERISVPIRNIVPISQGSAWVAGDVALPVAPLTPNDINLVQQVNWALRKNLDFCGSGEPLGAWHEIQALRDDFRAHLSWMMRLGNLQDMFSRFAVPNYLVRILYPLSQSIRLDFLLGKIPECFMEVRSLLEQLGRFFEADARFPKEKAFGSRLARVDAEETMLENLVESMDGNAADFLADLDNGWVQAQQPLTLLGNSPAVTGGPVAYTPQDVPEVLRLRNSVKKFRGFLSNVLERWKAGVEKTLPHSADEKPLHS